LDDGTVLVAFELPAAVAATSVALVGDFNGWSPGEHHLRPLDDGSFRAELPLAAGRRWRFRYLVDGDRWENDWAADDYVPNGLGTDDSVVDLTEAVPDAAPADASDRPAQRRRWWPFTGRRRAAGH
jgi:1,4-alpha-glucan branching enzyme